MKVETLRITRRRLVMSGCSLGALAAHPASPADSSSGADAMQTLMMLLHGKVHTQLLFAAAKLGLADALNDGPKSIEEMAAALNLNATALYRVMRALASLGVFIERDERQFDLTPAADLLRSGNDQSLRDFCIMFGSEWHNRSWSNILHSIETGEPAFDETFGMPIFDYLQEQAEARAIFQRAMTSVSQSASAAVREAYDFSRFETVADLGGGRGLLLASIIQDNPAQRGVLLELPPVARAAREYFQESGLQPRCRVLAGDFFTAVPAGADAYILKAILHDWDDNRCNQLLENCRAVMESDARLLVMERILPEDNSDPLVALGDIVMLMHPGGRERTEREFRRLLANGGFELLRVVSTNNMIRILEAAPA